MTAQFRCGSDKRRLLIAAPGVTLNGIDFLEALDEKAPAGSPPQRTLLVRLFKPVPATLGPDNLRIDGGVRTTSIHVQWAYPANAVPSPPANAAEETYFTTRIADPDHVLVVRTAVFGDFSTYRLSIVQSVAHDQPTPPSGFDPVLSHVDFSFKVECKSDFDCQQVDTCPPEVVPAPPINYLAKDYASFRRVLFDRMAAITPDWKERNPADLGVMLVEFLAYAGDQLSYYQDAVATEAYLGTARQRISVRRHARLLDYFMHEGVNARAWVCIEVSGTVVLRHTQPFGVTAFTTRVTEGPRINATPQQLDLLLQTKQARLFEPMHDAILFPQHNAINFYTWADEQCCLPAGATKATLRDDPANRLLLVPGDVLVLEEWLGRDGKNLPADADPLRRQAVRLVSVSPAATVGSSDPASPRVPGPLQSDPLTGIAYVQIEWHADDALSFPLCISTTNQGVPVLGVSGARGNVVLADHGRTMPVEPLPPPVSGTKYRPVLAWPEITHAVPYTHSVALTTAASATLAQDVRATVPQVVRLANATEEWTVVRDLLRADPFDLDFVVELDDRGFGHLRFGDGVLGKAPDQGLSATYRVGRGRIGNVGAEALAQVWSPDPAIIQVRNPLPATGGLDPEPIDDVKTYAPEAFRVQERAVTEDDYAMIAERHPDVLKARATRRWTGSWYTVFLTIDRKGGRPLDEPFREDLAAFMETFRLAGEDLEIELPIFIPLDINLVVCVKRGYFRAHVKRALASVFSNRRNADGTIGFFHPDHFTFGQPVFLSQVVAAAMNVDGVDWVDPEDPDFVFQRFAQLAAGEIAQGFIAMQRLEIARLDNDASVPENGRIQFELMGGQ
jgi:hypothetical protein